MVVAHIIQVPMPTDVLITIIVIAVLEVTLSIFLQRKLINQKKMRSLTRKMNEKSKELRELIKSNAAQDVIASKQKEIYPLMMEQTKHQFKSFVILPIFLAIYYVVLPAMFGSKNYFFMGLGYLEVFFVVVFVMGIISSVIVLLYDRKKAKLEAEEEKAAGS